MEVANSTIDVLEEPEIAGKSDLAPGMGLWVQVKTGNCS